MFPASFPPSPPEAGALSPTLSFDCPASGGFHPVFQSPAPHSAVCTNSSLSPSQLPARSPVRRQRPTKRAPFLACRRLVTNSISYFPESIVTCHTNPAQHKGHPGLPHDQLADDSSQESTAPLLRVWLGMVLRLLRVGQRVSFYCTLMVRSKHVASSE